MTKKLEELKERLEEISDIEKLENLYKALTHCWKCGSEVTLWAEVCETCGNELMEHGKN